MPDITPYDLARAMHAVAFIDGSLEALSGRDHASAWRHWEARQEDGDWLATDGAYMTLPEHWIGHAEKVLSHLEATQDRATYVQGWLLAASQMLRYVADDRRAEAERFIDANRVVAEAVEHPWSP